jgi:hypothetical protein
MMTRAHAAVPDVCKSEDDEENGNGESKKIGAPGDGIKFELWGACAEFSGNINYQLQRQLWKDPPGFSGLLTRRGTAASGDTLHTVTGTARLDITRDTSVGELKTAGEATWSWDSDANVGSGWISELYASLAGVTVGYTDSLMNFWSGDFSFQATAPARTVGIVSWKHEFTDALSLTIAAESGPPTSQSSRQGIETVDWSNPVLTGRWLYETDELTLHLSGLVREARFDPGTLPPFMPGATSRTGWAASAGATVAATPLGENDEFSMQATYASDASSYLGTTQDLSSLSGIVRVTGPTVGWSIVGSFHHEWSEQWKSNVFASYLALDAELMGARPSIRTRRAGANLQWLPWENLVFTAELGYVEQDIDTDRLFGLFTGVSGRALISYLTAEWKF